MLLKSNLTVVPWEMLGPSVALVCCASFESRSLGVARALSSPRISRMLVLKNSPAADQSGIFDSEVRNTFGSRAVFIETQIGHPVKTLDVFRRHVIETVKSHEGITVVDITTFTHEHLLILVFLFRQFHLLSKVVFAYSGAKEYGRSQSGGNLDNLWLTKGVSQVRSIVGFPGALVPSKLLHLVLMIGFERERAQTVIEAYEPARLSLGFSPKIMSVSAAMSETNRVFLERVRSFVQETRQGKILVGEFEFPCIDPAGTHQSLLAEIGNSREYNVIVCPLNTKLSTVGAALAAFEREDIQLCYAQAAIYNTASYSTPGDSITWFDLQDFQE